jgi:hypothetical protein
MNSRLRDSETALADGAGGGRWQYEEICLRRTGLRPLRFTGARLAAFEASAAAPKMFISLALYRTTGDGYASVWSCEPDPVADWAFLPWHEAHVFASVEPAIAAFEAASPSCVFDPVPEEAGLSATLLQAADIAAREALVRAAFANAAGTFLYDLCVRGGLEP